MKRYIRLQILVGALLTCGVAFSQQNPGSYCATHPNPLIASPSKIEYNAKNIFKTILVQIQNPTNAAVETGNILITGPGKNIFVLQYKDMIIVKKGSPQPDEACSNSSIPPHGSCSFRIKQLSSKPVNSSATIHISVGKCDLLIPVRESGGHS